MKILVAPIWLLKRGPHLVHLWHSPVTAFLFHTSTYWSRAECARNAETLHVYAIAIAPCCGPSPATRHLSYTVVEEKRVLHTA